jgi:hypothetical protein
MTQDNFATRFGASPVWVNVPGINWFPRLDCTKTIEAVLQEPLLPINQHGLTGSWYNPATTGQGFFLEVYPNQFATGQGQLFVGWYTYDVAPAGGAERQRWYTMQGPVGDARVPATVSVTANYGGNFAQPPSTIAVGIGSATIKFSSCTTGELTYQFNDGRNGVIPLTRLTENLSCTWSGTGATAPQDALRSGSWFDPATSGQGMIIDINPSNNRLVFGGWYTYAPNGQAIGGPASQRWYTFQGENYNLVGNNPVASVTIHETTGGTFNQNASQQTIEVGTATVQFTSCTALQFSYSFSGGTSAGLSGTRNLVRVGPPPPGCQ